MKTLEGIPGTHVRLCVMGYKDNLIIDDGIQYWVKMLGIKSGSLSQYPLFIISMQTISLSNFICLDCL